MKKIVMMLALALGLAGHAQQPMVESHEQLFTDVSMDLSHPQAAEMFDQVMELCNNYANRRFVNLRVNHFNDQRFVNQVLQRRRVANRRNVRVQFVRQRARVVALRSQVRLNVRSRRVGVFNRVFNRGFFLRDRFAAQRVIAVRVRL